MATSAKLTVLGALSFIAACSSMSRAPGAATYPPRDKPAEIIWSSQESGLDPSSYEIIGTGQNETGTCGITKAINDSANHQKLARMGADIGGDAILLNCGDVGTTGQCLCTAKVLKFGTGGLRRKSDGNLKGCTTDNECKGARICKDGKCVDPT
jgi:hypothetical protein